MPDPTTQELQADIKAVKDLVAPFKEYAMHGAPSHLVTEKALTDQFAPVIKDIKDIHQEVVNPLAVELLQQLRLDTLAAALKKSPFFENNEAWWAYALTAAAGIFVTLAAGALLLRLGAWITTKLPTFFTGGAGGGGGLTAAQVEELRAKLEATNPLLRDYADQVRRLPRAKELTARATAVGKLNNAVAAQNNTAVTEAADAIKSLKSALRNFDPKKLPRDHAALTRTATAIGKLDTAIRALNIQMVRDATSAFLRLKIILRNLKPSDIPKSADMRSSARAARTLTSATRSLTGALTPLGPALRGVISSAQTTAGALG
ncbi:hypothetical protein [Streptomyces sp. NPDC048357]|uniref:hypothetical protein n=1 Tax=Streptomyces sp. NPDC048357 TaxID=3154719 RepID=UPI003415C87A